MAITISVLGLIFLLLVLFVIFRKDDQPARNRSVAAKIRLQETSAFHSVSIKHGARACDAARQMSGQRILSKEVPGLPLFFRNVIACTFAGIWVIAEVGHQFVVGIQNRHATGKIRHYHIPVLDFCFAGPAKHAGDDRLVIAVEIKNLESGVFSIRHQ